jgi:spore coat protein U-like protein
MKLTHKIVATAMVAATLAATTPLAHAGSDAKTFTVQVALTAGCTITTGPGTVDFGTYIANQLTAATGSTTFGVTCTNTLPYTFSLDGATASVKGLSYTLSFKSGATTVTGGTGSGSEQTYTIAGNMAANQAGDSSASATQTRTLTVSY